MAAETNDVVLLKQLYSKLAEALSIGTPTAVSGQNYLSLCNPGILLDPALDLTKAAGQATLATILNAVPNPNWVYSQTGESVANVYDDVLKSKELPIVELTAAQKKQLQEAQDLLMGPKFEMTPRYENYLKYKKQYEDALTAYQTARTTAANTGAEMPPGVEDALDQARKEWNSFGFRAQIDGAQATINNLQQLDPNAWWERLEGQYEKATVKGVSTFQLTNVYPDYKILLGDRGWTSFSFSKTDATHQATASAVSAGGGASASWGLWRVAAEADYSKSKHFESNDALGMTVNMEMMRATIMRPWLDPLVFRAHSWRFGAQFHNQHVSMGTFVPGTMPDGTLMPLFPTGILVARNLSISGAFSHADQERISEAISGSASVGWGPFAISGHYSQSKESEISHANASATAIANPDPQIIGFFCDVLPVSPSPDPTLQWPS
jgi:hypothetical protein